jgi:hypothetical protein
VKTVGIGCLMGPVTWLAVSAALSFYLQTQTGAAFTETIGASLIAGVFGSASLGLLLSSAHRWRERAAIRGGIAGERPVDGRRTVLVGTLEPIGATLRAPLDGGECLAYSYDISETRGSGKRRSTFTHFKGVGLTPSMIVTRTGSYRLLVVPDLEADAPGASVDEMIAAFRRHAHGTTFTGPDTSAQELLDRWSDADGAYRSDVSYTPLDQVDLSRCQFTQQSVSRGAAVCVFGPYSAARGGIVPSSTSPVRLICGSVEQVAASLRSKVITRLVLGVIAGAAAVAVVTLVSAGT